MAITSGFFNSVNKDRTYNAAQIGKYLQYIVSSGVFPYVSTSLQVLANDGMEVEVQAGRAMLDHHYMDNDAPITLKLTAGGTQDRIDAVIMYVDMTERACGITIKEGTPAAAPVAPAMTRTDVRKEYMLAKVYVTKLATAITQSSITDTRADTTVCGWVTGLIKQVDTSTLFKQWQTAYEEEFAKTQDYLAAQQAAWQTFFDSVTHDNVLPAPALTQAGYVVTVNANGTGYVLMPGVTTDNTLSQSGQAADAAAVGRALTAPNLLVNSDFKNPVNRTGFTGGAPSADNVLFIDKWKTQQNVTKNIEIYFSDSGLIVHVSTGLAGIAQRIPKPKTGVTFSAKVNGKIESVYSRHGVDESVKTTDDVLLYVEWLENELQVIIRNTGDDPNEYTIEWAALYEGEYTAETLPKYQPRGYSVEQVVCTSLSMELLWENASPTSAFAAQTVSLDLSQFDAIKIIMRISTGSDAQLEYEIMVDSASYVLPRMANTNMYRQATANPEGVSFTAAKNFASYGQTTTTTDNTLMIPIAIYGIKGVSA